MYSETSGKNCGSDNLFVSLERTRVLHITNITFYYNRFSTGDLNLRSMGRFRIQLIIEDNFWTTKYTIPKNDQYSNFLSHWKLLNLDFTEKNYGIKLIYDQKDTTHADMCFSNITKTHSVF